MPPPKAGTKRAKRYKGLRWVGAAKKRTPYLEEFLRRRAATLKGRIPATIAEANERNSQNRSETRKATPPARRTQQVRIREENVPDYIRKAVERSNYPANIFDTIAARQGINNARRTQLIQWVSNQYTPTKLERAEALQRGRNLAKRAEEQKKLLQEAFAKHVPEIGERKRGGLGRLMTKAVNYFTKKRK